MTSIRRRYKPKTRWVPEWCIVYCISVAERYGKWDSDVVITAIDGG